MGKITTILFAVLFSLYSLSNNRTITNTITVDNNGNGTTVTISDDEVLIDGKSVDEYVDEQINGIENDVVQDTTLYRSKNVDAYNKWYNKNKERIKSEPPKKKCNGKLILKIVFFILLGLMWIYIGSLIIKYMKIRIEYKRIKKHKFPFELEQQNKSQKIKNTESNKGVPVVEEIKSPIKKK